MATKLIAGHFYRISDRGHIMVGEYAGRQEFECVVCRENHPDAEKDFGQNCRVFNFFYAPGQWQTFGFGARHFPEVLEDLGTYEVLDE